MRGHVTAPRFPLSNRVTDVRRGCKIQRIAPTLRQVADLVCARTKERVFQNMYCWTRELLPSVWSTLRPSPHWRQPFTYLTRHVCKHYNFFGARAHQVGCDFHLVEASELSFVYCSRVLRQRLYWTMEGKDHYVTTRNSSDICHTNHKASLIMQVIRLACSMVEKKMQHQSLLLSTHACTNKSPHMLFSLHYVITVPTANHSLIQEPLSSSRSSKIPSLTRRLLFFKHRLM
ncbi:hypothetical protein PoB_005903700 [Plakobranchus ocellatus]|uniref:Uncharacterized protein n=1 Tax=Plakobranchus ocellatus TaxID=259542 RepID=A0AAV4CL56_9GAST|nr:hypothetical protein PoB_005903700 [Plakobranchus ocellatus]